MIQALLTKITLQPHKHAGSFAQFCAMMCRIDLMIAGAQKAGTTSLKNYLGQHHALCTHLQTEFPYFIEGSPQAGEMQDVFRWFFPTCKEGQLVAAKSAGLYHQPHAIHRLYEHNPQCHIVLVLRNPVERAYSSYLMECDNGYLTTPFDDIVHSIRQYNSHGTEDQMFRLFVNLGLYHKHLENIYSKFPPQQVKLFLFEDLCRQAPDICREIFQWIGVDPSFSPDVGIHYNPTANTGSPLAAFLLRKIRYEWPWLKMAGRRLLSGKTYATISNKILAQASRPYVPPPMKPEIRKVLADFFRPHNEVLSRSTGFNLDGWE